MFVILAHNWWTLLLRGLLAVTFGILTFIDPGLTLLTLAMIFGVYALIDGIFAIIAAAIRLRKQIMGEWLLILSGIASVLFGVLIAALPGTGALAVAWLIGAYAIVFGVLFIVLSFRLRSWSTRQAVPRPA